MPYNPACCTEDRDTDYDSPWKEILDRYFAALTALFFLDVHQGIDWDRGYAGWTTGTMLCR